MIIQISFYWIVYSYEFYINFPVMRSNNVCIYQWRTNNNLLRKYSSIDVIQIHQWVPDSEWIHLFIAWWRDFSKCFFLSLIKWIWSIKFIKCQAFESGNNSILLSISNHLFQYTNVNCCKLTYHKWHSYLKYTQYFCMSILSRFSHLLLMIDWGHFHCFTLNKNFNSNNLWLLEFWDIIDQIFLEKVNDFAHNFFR